jgi:uroporphyrinogen decarboxylase
MKTEEKPLFRALRGASTDRQPYWLMRQAGRYLPEYREIRAQAGGFLDLCLNPDLAAEVTLQPIRRFGMDAAILFSDILVVPHGLGQKVSFQEGEGPVLEPIVRQEELSRLDLSAMIDTLQPVYQAVGKIRYDLPPETVLIGFAGSPWTVATYMVEGKGNRLFETVKTWAAEEPAGFGQLIDILVEGTIRHLSAQIEAGVEIVQLFDSWAGVLQDGEFEQWVVRPTKRIVAALKAKFPKVPIIGFPRGAGAQYLGYARETGIDILSIDQNVPLAFARDVLQPVLPVQGNLDPILLATGGPALQARTKEIVTTLGRGKFIFNLGHGIQPHTPPENVAQLSEILRSGAGSRH